MNTLVIDAANSKEIVVGLQIERKKYFLKHKTDSKKAQVILPMIEKLLKKNKIETEDIDSIEVNAGPGSFTGLRIGISIANTLGMILKIPVNGKTGELVEPIYK
ncbi:MAG: tRNA (adenosine(37)-N6)-threonylcarbamoyltransferase complex dimerization subunit type 1 TsaB [Patescibacteria group bacterium]